MNTNKAFPFMFQRTITTSDDIDNLPNGIYGVNASFGASVNGVNYGVLSSFGNTSSSSGFRYQTLYNTASSQTGFYFRTKSDKGWNAWRTSDNFGYNTLAELSEGISKLGTFEERNNDIDLNELTPNKWYLIGTANANKPEGTMSELAFVKTEYVGGIATPYYIQTYIGWTDDSRFIRTCRNQVWYHWRAF